MKIIRKERETNSMYLHCVTHIYDCPPLAWIDKGIVIKGGGINITLWYYNFCFRQLKCTRVTIHKHLFLSYILTAVLWISYYGASSFHPHVVQENPVSIILYQEWVSEWVSEWQFINASAISWREQVNFQWDDDVVRFVLNQHAELDLYSASSLKHQSAGRHVAPLLLTHYPDFEPTSRYSISCMLRA